MKKGFILLSLFFLLAVSCSDHELDVHELDTKVATPSRDDVFYASLESYSAPDTRVYLDENIKILWDGDEQISIFNRTTQNQQFEFQGEAGDNAGYFYPVSESSTSGDPLGFICAVYPFQCSTTISNEGVLALTLPEEQTYRNESFGPGANTMVSSTEDNLLKFKNLCGYLVLKFYGKGVSVSSIKLEGHRNERLSGQATLTPAVGVLPTIAMDPAAGTSITLNCETPVELNATQEDATLFWMVVPPTDFTEGFKLTVTDPDGKVFIKETSVNLSIARNEVLRIAPIKVKPVPVNYAKASSITVGGTYLIVDAEDQRLFRGAIDGSYVTVTPDEKGVITDTDGSFADYEFTVENSGDNYYLQFNDGKYLICDYTNNSSAGLRYVDTQSDMRYPYAVTTGTDGAFFFNTTNLNGNVPNQFIYFKPGTNSGSNVFKIGQSGSSIGVHLYMKNGKLDRGLRFNPENVLCSLGDTPEQPVLSGTYTTVTYSSSDDDIATVDAEGKVTPLTTGIVTITASSEEDDQYNAGTASYTLEIRKQDRNLRFTPEMVDCTLESTPEKPDLTGSYTTVTYSSSNDRIATVDAGGNVTLHAHGIATITATAGEDEQFMAGSASYTLKVKFNPDTKKYLRVTSADQINLDGEYVLVYENGATQKAFKPILNTGKNAFLTTAENAVDVTIIDNEMEASEVDDCRIMLANPDDKTPLKFSLIVPEADGATDYYWYVYRSSVFAAKAFSDNTEDTGFRSTFALGANGQMTLSGNNNYNFRYSNIAFDAASRVNSSNLYLFVRDGSTKQKQTLSFDKPTVTWQLGDYYVIDNIYDYPQEVTGAQTPVTYSCGPESVAKIENGRIKIVNHGTATITATAAKSDEYYAATASYTLRILRAAPGGWVDMGSFDLENDALKAYLDDAESAYTDTNDGEITVMNKYASGNYTSSSRKDCPNPVTIEWADPASNSTVISIFESELLTNPVLTQNATANATSASVYNLIPGRKYYYTVSEDGTVWEKGFFNTTGRRRMIKVSNSYGRGYANNCRDLGGLIVSDHGTQKTIKYGYLFRGTNMDRTSANVEWPILLDFMNIGRDIDLRNGNASNPGSSDQGNTTCYCPWPNNEVLYTAPGIADGTNFDDLSDPVKVGQIFMAFYNTVKSGKATYFHCYSGADRTGYIAMLIEGLLGVSEKDCTIDYELTSFSVSGGRYRVGQVQGQSQEYVFRQGIAFLRGKGKTDDTFQEKIENYLVSEVEIDQDVIDEFKRLVLE